MISFSPSARLVLGLTMPNPRSSEADIATSPDGGIEAGARRAERTVYLRYLQRYRVLRSNLIFDDCLIVYLSSLIPPGLTALPNPAALLPTCGTARLLRRRIFIPVSSPLIPSNYGTERRGNWGPNSSRQTFDGFRISSWFIW